MRKRKSMMPLQNFRKEIYESRTLHQQNDETFFFYSFLISSMQCLIMNGQIAFKIKLPKNLHNKINDGESQ